MALAATAAACATGSGPAPVAAPSRIPTPATPPDPVPALAPETETPAAGDFTESAAESASIDEVAALPLGEAPPSPEALARAAATVAAEISDLPIELNQAVLSCIDLYEGRLRDWFLEALSRGQSYLPHMREVPLIHAAIVLAKAPERYGFTVTPPDVTGFESVPIEGAVDLRVIAECAGEPVDDVRALNPELRRLATPADRTFALRVPAGRGATVTECVAKLPPEKRVAFRKHVVRQGQTLAGIARANGVSAREIAEANGLSRAGRLRPGTELIVPVPAAPRATATHQAAAVVSPDGPVLYRIQPGDTLASIAARHGTTVRELQVWNGLRSSRIAAGDVLTIRTGNRRDRRPAVVNRTSGDRPAL